MGSIAAPSWAGVGVDVRRQFTRERVSEELASVSRQPCSQGLCVGPSTAPASSPPVSPFGNTLSSRHISSLNSQMLLSLHWCRHRHAAVNKHGKVCCHAADPLGAVDIHIIRMNRGGRARGLARGGLFT